MGKNAEGEPTLVLPDELRARLKPPLGQLFPDVEAALEHLRKLRPSMLITVGDVVTAGFLAAGVRPDVAVVDFLVMRGSAGEDLKKLIDAFEGKVVRVRNPPGALTPEMRRAMEGITPPLKIIVEGEEDLAAIPTVLSAPLGSAVVYGQPGEGVVVVQVTDLKRREFADILKEFKPTHER